MQSKDKLYRSHDPEEVGYETETRRDLSLDKKHADFPFCIAAPGTLPCEARTNLEVHKRMCEADAGWFNSCTRFR